MSCTPRSLLRKEEILVPVNASLLLEKEKKRFKHCWYLSAVRKCFLFCSEFVSLRNRKTIRLIGKKNLFQNFFQSFSDREIKIHLRNLYLIFLHYCLKIIETHLDFFHSRWRLPIFNRLQSKPSSNSITQQQMEPLLRNIGRRRGGIPELSFHKVVNHIWAVVSLKKRKKIQHIKKVICIFLETVES